MKALILGTAASVTEDEKAARAMFKPDIVIAVNHIGIDHPGPIHHWVSCHAESFPEWVAKRAEANHLKVGQLWTNDETAKLLTGPLKAMGIRGAPYSETSSGGLAVEVAILLGADRIVGAGLPLDNGIHYYGDESGAFMKEAHYRRGWLKKKPEWADRFRSMSGWTSTEFGRPTKAWLKEPVTEPDNEGE